MFIEVAVKLPDVYHDWVAVLGIAFILLGTGNWMVGRIRTEQYSRIIASQPEISADEGGAFSAYGGRVLGRNVALVPGARIVQAWRASGWPDHVYTIIRFELPATNTASPALPR